MIIIIKKHWNFHTSFTCFRRTSQYQVLVVICLSLGFGVEKGESTSRKEFYRLTGCNRLYVLETNYWGVSQPFKYLKDNNLIKDNLRIVRNFGRFYNLPKFNEIGENLAKSIIKVAYLDGVRSLKIFSPLLNELHRDVKKIYKRLSSKSKKRKLKKQLKKQTKKFMQLKQKPNITSLAEVFPPFEARFNHDIDSEIKPIDSEIVSTAAADESHNEENEEPYHSDGVEDSNHEEAFKGQDVDDSKARI